MASVTVTPIDVRPLNGNVTINAVVGGAMSIGDAAYIAADGDWERADADAAATAMVAGICVSTPRTGVTDAVAGDRCDFVILGPMTGFSGLTPGSQLFASTTPGEIDDTAPAGSSADFKWIIGTGGFGDFSFWEQIKLQEWTMATLGIAALADLEIHPLWDLDEMKKLELVDGTTFDEALSELQEAANLLSASLTSMPHYSSLFSVQDNVEVEYATGVTNGVQEATEFSAPDAKRGKTTGHNIPIKMWTRALGWTILGLRDRRREQIVADTTSALDDMRDHFQQRMLQRFFKMEAEAVGATSGASVPLIDGGTADSTYRPPDSPDGKKFTTSHDHFLRLATLDATMFDTVADHLHEHGITAPWECVISETDLATAAALTNWNAPNWSESKHGLFKVFTSPRVPANYLGFWKDYGRLDPRNPVRMRINPRIGFGWQLVPGTYLLAPQLLAVLHSEYDFGISENRINGVCVEIDSAGDYATPTIA
jgi:hypothetical protein